MTHSRRLRVLPARVVEFGPVFDLVIQMLTCRRVPYARAWAQLYAARALQYFGSDFGHDARR
jgi:hypothetical protein